MSIRRLTVVVKSTDRDTTIEQYSELLESDVLQEFTIADTELMVSVLPGLSILSGTTEALTKARSLVATACPWNVPPRFS